MVRILTESFDTPEHLCGILSEGIDVDQKAAYLQTFADVRIRRISFDLLNLNRTLLAENLLGENGDQQRKQIHLEIKASVLWRRCALLNTRLLGRGTETIMGIDYIGCAREEMKANDTNQRLPIVRGHYD